MYSLLKQVPRRELLLEHAPSAGGSLLVAELFYKFGSFTLEALAFLATWFLADLAYRTLRQVVESSAEPTA